MIGPLLKADLVFPAYRPQCKGFVIGTRGPIIIARLPQASIGDACFIELGASSALTAQIIGFDNDTVSLAPFNTLDGLCPGAVVKNTAQPFSFEIPADSRGCILDACANIIYRSSDNENSKDLVSLCVDKLCPSSLTRKPIKKKLQTGIRSIDALLTLGLGQRVGLFSAAGVGKSTLLNMIAKNAQVDVKVIALVGERGREVPAFVHNIMESTGSNNSVFVVSTSDESPVRRLLAPKTATAIAEYYRNQGKNVLLLIDSLTRTARAIREIGLSMGEIPVRQGYTPSVYTELPRLLERAGNNDKGSITAIYSVLLGGEEESDPLAEEIKSILDGHIVMSHEVARRGIYPAIDIVESNSRLFSSLHPADYVEQWSLIYRMLARLKKDKEILLLGGSPDKELAAALEMEDRFKDFLCQDSCSNIPLKESCAATYEIAEQIRKTLESNALR